MFPKTALLLTILCLGACRSVPSDGSGAARLYDGIDRYHRPITTDSPAAQQWFDQGVQLLYGFNHDEAIRSFQRAADLDPGSPMPWWGIAYAHGININDPKMTEARWRDAYAAAVKAIERVSAGSAVEADLVRAIAERYSWPPPAEQRTLDLAYADAMKAVHERHPDDPDVAVLYAESLMDLQPWDYWTNEGAPRGRAAEIVAVLASVLAAHPDHPGAAHFYIHAVEASSDPDRAIVAADSLRNRIPGAGHLVHMPSHIYVRVGRYADAADANVLAVAADRRYLKTAPPAKAYWIYYAHNLHFLAYASMMEGRYHEAIRAARALESDLPEPIVRDFAGLIEGILGTTFHVMVRFGRWEEILAEPQRAEHRLVSRAVRSYARGLAFSALGRIEEARSEIAAFESAAAEIPGDWWVFNNKVDTVLPIARAMLEGELAFREGRLEVAFAALRSAVEMEDALIYDEPPAWMLPVRHALGALLMSAGHHAEAEEVYREDLRRNRDNGWALLGLRQALTAQGTADREVFLDAKLKFAFARADVRPSSSCLCEPRENWSARGEGEIDY
ncbi:MAG: hypothetical protein CMJ18_13155 [Phycisphaeraceae bacterium]|nr:hypothetical protein [Phycisphaeraceae bacterium]